VSTVGLPVTVMFAQRGADPWLETVDPVRPAAVCRGRIDPAVSCGHDRQVIIGHKIGEIGIAPAQRHDDRIRTVGPYLDDRIDDGLGGRSAVGAAVIVDRRDHIVSRHGSAAVEGDPRSDSQRPDRGIGAGFPAFCHFAYQRAVGCDLRQIVVPSLGKDLDKVRVSHAGIVVVYRAPRVEANPQSPALVRF
jgi:hypothetical protein